jgi:hypothetical protein
MAAIFLSYSRDNEGLADVVAKDLMMLGHEVWFDRELSGGQVWWNQILTCRTERFSGIVLRVAVSGRDAR